MFGGFLIVVGCAVVRGEMEGHIVGGNFASIQRYPHSAFLTVTCVDILKTKKNWICGSSVLNQELLLTAAHCVDSCLAGTTIVVHLGDEFRNKGVMRQAHSFIQHEDYDTKTSEHDIALVRLATPLKLQEKISRVAIMRNPPYGEPATIAGWGITDEVKMLQGYKIKHIDQNIWNHAQCEQKFGVMPMGAICGSSKIKQNFAAQGDSGSALVVRGYIQVGLVSYKVPSVAANIIIYTDVGYYYDWINLNARRLFCV